MTSLPEPPADLSRFPSLTWGAQQPLWRVHRESRASVHFATDGHGRFDPPTPDAGYGTWYLSTHPHGAFVEVFGRLGFATRRQIDERVLASLFLPSDLRLADLTHPTVIGGFRVTNELSTGGTEVYGLAQRWSAAFWRAGFAGVSYPARHDPTLQVRSVALFGKPADADSLETAVVRAPLADVAEELADFYGWTIVSGTSL